MHTIQIAGNADAASITALLNSAYRGEGSKQGWTTEADLISGDVRTTEEILLELIAKPGSVLLKCTNEAGHITGCVNLQQQGAKIYLGMLSVSPALQGRGTGKQLLAAAEEYAEKHHYHTIYMSVISVRTELINWYIRHGYLPTGETQPFPDDPRTGTPTQPLEFIILEKKLVS
jgi:ribosomal protein S18 acetylase RimI-like enzyme